jgi:hypothetical protein
VPTENRRDSKSKLKINWRVLKKASKRRLTQQRRKVPRSTSGLSKRSKRPRRKLLKPMPRLNSLPRRLRIRSTSLIWARSKT